MIIRERMVRSVLNGLSVLLLSLPLRTPNSPVTVRGPEPERDRADFSLTSRRRLRRKERKWEGEMERWKVAVLMFLWDCLSMIGPLYSL